MSSSTGIQLGFINQNVKNSGFLVSGLYYQIYNGYFNDDLTFFDSASYLFPSGSTGFSSDFTNIGLSTNQKIQSNQNLTYFSVQWTGYLTTPSGTSGTWTFSSTSDDSSYIWIGNNALSGYTTGNSLINNGSLHPNQIITNTITLSASTTYPIRIMYGQSMGNYDISVRFTPPGGTSKTNGNGYYFSGQINSFDVPINLGYLSGNKWFFNINW